MVELGLDVSTGIEDAVPEIRFVKVGETELPNPEFEPIAVAILPEGKKVGETELPSSVFEPTAVAVLPEDKVVVIDTTSIKLDVRKQTYHICLASPRS